jgi:hypothetical protein
MIWAQACLSRLLGIELPQDGFVGPDTQQAIASFQTEQRLPSTGRLDDNTASALRALCGGREEGAYREPDYSKEFDDPFEERDVAVWNIPTKGWYKGIENNPWGGLPEILYPETPDDFMSVTKIYIDVDQMARIQFDARTIVNDSSGARRLLHAPPEWASSFVQERVSGSRVPSLAELETEYNRLRHGVLNEIASMKKSELREFLLHQIHIVLPPFYRTQKLRRTERFEGGIAPSGFFGPNYLREDRLIRILLQHSR